MLRRFLLGSSLVLAAATCGARSELGTSIGGSTSTTSMSSSGAASCSAVPCAKPEDCPGRACIAGTCGGGWLWAGWPMPNPPSTGLPNPASYDTSTEAVVVDKVTCLMWEQPANGPGGTLSTAHTYCAGLSLAGHNDWRLPTIIELVSLVDFTQADGIDPIAFPGTPPDFFWSSSPLAGAASVAWAVSFDQGYRSILPVASTARVRCVR